MVQYSIGLSIILGLLASSASYYIATWWKFDQYLGPEETSGIASWRDQIIQVEESKSAKSQIILKKQTHPTTLFEWVVRKNRGSSRDDRQ
ncbi:MAG: hypothetical protein HC835_13640 [Oscillatoriales cyanobacterium RM2_1_1]|nr:hypothetical protein [Oscillatoriales cyanobacterium RM2_1_1]